MCLENRNGVSNMIHMSVSYENVIHIQSIDIVLLRHLKIT